MSARAVLRRTLPAFALGVATPAALAAQQAAAAPYQHYVAPACIQAAYRTTQFLGRSGPDTARYDYARATTPDSTRLEARRCIARFDVATVPTRDLVAYARALLAAGDDAAAERAVQRRLAAEASAPAVTRAATLADVVQSYLQAQPHRVEPARRHLATLDAMADSAAVIGRFEAHAAMASHHAQAGEGADAMREAEAVIALGKRLDDHDRREFGLTLWNAYAILAEQAAAPGGAIGAAAARTVLQRGRADIAGLGPQAVEALTRLDSIFALPGRKAPPIAATRWVGGEGEQTVRPRAGRTTLVLFGVDRSTMPMVRRLLAANPALDLVLVNRTQGHFRGAGPLKPAAELDSLARWFTEELRAPGVVALETPEVVPQADGRMPRRPTRTESSYQVTMGAGGVIVDSQGVIRHVFRLSYETHIERLLAATR